MRLRMTTVLLRSMPALAGRGIDLRMDVDARAAKLCAPSAHTVSTWALLSPAPGLV